MLKSPISLNLRYLKAAAIATTTCETRYYLKGVAVQYDGATPFLHLIATDGHRLMALRHPLDDSTETPAEPFSIIIPLGVITSLKIPRGSDMAFLVQLSPNRWQIMPQGGAPSIAFDIIDGTFPDWRRIVPKELSGELGHFSFEYLGDFSKIAKALGQKNPTLKLLHNGENVALVSFGTEIDGFGIIMPLRTNIPHITDAPSWARGA